MSEKKIIEALGLRPMEEIEEAEIVSQTDLATTVEMPILPATAAQDEMIEDIEKAKKNIASLIEQGSESLDELVDVAKQSQNPRAYEVVSTLIKTLVDANKEFIGMAEKKKYAKEDHSSAEATTNVTNNNLILSTTDLLKMIKGDN